MKSNFEIILKYLLIISGIINLMAVFNNCLLEYEALSYFLAGILFIFLGIFLTRTSPRWKRYILLYSFLAALALIIFSFYSLAALNNMIRPSVWNPESGFVNVILILVVNLKVFTAINLILMFLILFSNIAAVLNLDKKQNLNFKKWAINLILKNEYLKFKGLKRKWYFYAAELAAIIICTILIFVLASFPYNLVMFIILLLIYIMIRMPKLFALSAFGILLAVLILSQPYTLTVDEMQALTCKKIELIKKDIVSHEPDLQNIITMLDTSNDPDYSPTLDDVILLRANLLRVLDYREQYAAWLLPNVLNKMSINYIQDAIDYTQSSDLQTLLVRIGIADIGKFYGIYNEELTDTASMTAEDKINATKDDISLSLNKFINEIPIDNLAYFINLFPKEEFNRELIKLFTDEEKQTFKDLSSFECFPPIDDETLVKLISMENLRDTIDSLDEYYDMFCIFDKRNLNIWINLNYFFKYKYFNYQQDCANYIYSTDQENQVVNQINQCKKRCENNACAREQGIGTSCSNSNAWNNSAIYQTESAMPLIQLPLISKYIGPEYFEPINIIDVVDFIRGEFGSGLTIKTRDWIFGELDCSGMPLNSIITFLNSKSDDVARIARFQITGSSNGQPVTVNYDTDYQNMPDFNTQLSQDFPENGISHITMFKNVEKIIRYKPNARKFIDTSNIPFHTKLGYVLVEDDNFFIEPGGFDITGIINATFNYVVHSSQKGNASITEQFYEMYVGKQNKTPIDKLFQLAGAAYLTYYVEDREQILDRYIQSIHGSWWGEHCYGIAGICENYLDKNNLDFRDETDANAISERELAWLTRIAMQPNEIGQKFARYHMLGSAMSRTAENAMDCYSSSGCRYLNIESNMDVLRFIELRGFEALQLISSVADTENEYEYDYLTGNENIWKLDMFISRLPSLCSANRLSLCMEPQMTDEDIINSTLEKIVRDPYSDNSIRDKDAILGLLTEIYNEGNTPDKVLRVLLGAVRLVIDYRGAYQYTIVSVDTALKNFRMGNLFVDPIISEEDYASALTKDITDISFESSKAINKFQPYTDQTKLDIIKRFGQWGLNSGLTFTVHMDEATQNAIFKELETDCLDLEEHRDKAYGGSAVLVQLHDIRDRTPQNNIVAIVVRHVGDGDFSNWAVSGLRHFGSIFKWIIMLLYFEEGGTPKDYFYDIPREWPTINQYGEDTVFTPDNWRSNFRDIYGFFTWHQQNMAYNFVQSKNNTFVKILEEVSPETTADFINMYAEFPEDYPWRVRPIYPLVLGSEAIPTVRFAQLLAIIGNDGIFKPLSTIDTVLRPGDTVAERVITPEEKAVEPEAAEMSFYLGVMNPYFGTAKRFWQGAACKTGSYERKAISFAAMTSRGPENYIEEIPDHLLNSNLLYLVEIGVNTGTIGPAMFGGIGAAKNAVRVFEFILEKDPAGEHVLSRFSDSWNQTQERFRYPISDNKVLNYPPRSPNLELKEVGWDYRYNGEQVLLPMPIGIGDNYFRESDVNRYSQEELEQIQSSYEYRADLEFVEDIEQKIERSVRQYVNSHPELREMYGTGGVNMTLEEKYQLWTEEIYHEPEDYEPRVNEANKYAEIMVKWELLDLGLSFAQVEEIIDKPEIRDLFIADLHSFILDQTMYGDVDYYNQTQNDNNYYGESRYSNNNQQNSYYDDPNINRTSYMDMRYSQYSHYTPDYADDDYINRYQPEPEPPAPAPQQNYDLSDMDWDEILENVDPDEIFRHFSDNYADMDIPDEDDTAVVTDQEDDDYESTDSASYGDANITDFLRGIDRDRRRYSDQQETQSRMYPYERSEDNRYDYSSEPPRSGVSELNFSRGVW